MANKRIGQTTNRSTTTATDLIPFERSNAMNNITQADFMGDVEDYLAAATKTIVSKTYAQWEVIRAASGLGIYFNTWVFVSDKSVYLTPVAVNQFALNGIWKNTVSAVDYYNICEYYFLHSGMGGNGRRNRITDSFKNSLSNPDNSSDSNLDLFLWNKSTFLNNYSVNGVIQVTSNLGVVNSNIILNGFLVATNSTATSTISFNELSYGTLTATTNSGTFTYNNVMCHQLIANLNVGISVNRCVFSFRDSSGAPGIITLDPSVSYTNKQIRKGYSDFDVTITQTGLTTLTNHATYGKHIGIFNITSTNATETIDLFANAPTNHPFRIYPETGLTITLTHGTGANQPICAGGISAVLNGTNGDWIEYTYNATTSRYYQTDGETY